jgi:hypothetical protein
MLSVLTSVSMHDDPYVHSEEVSQSFDSEQSRTSSSGPVTFQDLRMYHETS